VIPFKGFTHLLVLLLLSGCLDDAWAVVTPDADDDRLAAENNEYPPRPSQYLRTPAPARDLPLPGDLLAAGLSGTGPAHPTTQPAQLPVPSGPPLLYVLMSLQR
jgi:hypothetical protein